MHNCGRAISFQLAHDKSSGLKKRIEKVYVVVKFSTITKPRILCSETFLFSSFLLQKYRRQVLRFWGLSQVASLGVSPGPDTLWTTRKLDTWLLKRWLNVQIVTKVCCYGCAGAFQFDIDSSDRHGECGRDMPTDGDWNPEFAFCNLLLRCTRIPLSGVRTCHVRRYMHRFRGCTMFHNEGVQNRLSWARWW